MTPWDDHDNCANEGDALAGKRVLTEPRLRILIVTRNLPPLVGGMERLNWHMTRELLKHAEVRVVGPTGAVACAPPGVAIAQVALEPLPRFLLGAQWKALRLARTWRPDIVLAGSGLTAPLAWLAAKACDARSAVYVHGLDLAVQHAAYRALWLPAIRRIDTVIANSHATRTLAIEHGVAADRISIVHPGVDLPTTEPAPESIAEFRTRHQLGQGPVLLSVGRLSRRKGLREFVADVLPPLVAVKPDVVLLIAGDAPRQALHAEAQSPQSIQAVADAKGIGANIRFLGAITDHELATAYQAADVHVFPVQHVPGDPEGFGMVAIEAAAHGLPTVAYANGGAIDAVADGRSGSLVSPGNADAMACAIVETLAHKDVLHATCKAFAENYAWPAFGERLQRALWASPP